MKISIGIVQMSVCLLPHTSSKRPINFFCKCMTSETYLLYFFSVYPYVRTDVRLPPKSLPRFSFFYMCDTRHIRHKTLRETHNIIRRICMIPDTFVRRRLFYMYDTYTLCPSFFRMSVLTSTNSLIISTAA